jgi:hypothetical protein
VNNKAESRKMLIKIPVAIRVKRAVSIKPPGESRLCASSVARVDLHAD